MIWRSIKFTFSTFQERKVRSILTMIGIFIGIAMIVTLIALGQGLKTSIVGQFEELGVNKIMVSPGSSFMGLGSLGGPKLTDKDIDVIKKTPGIDFAGGMSYKMARVKFGEQTKYTWVIGLPLDESKKIIQDMQSFTVERGRDLMEGDKYEAMVGINLYNKKFYDKSVDLRSKIEVEGIDMKVIGVIGKIGNPQDDAQVYIPLDTANEIFYHGEKNYVLVIAQVSNGLNPEEVAASVEKKLRNSREVKEGEEDFTVQTMTQMMDSFATILNIVQAVLIGLATISILVGGVGIMNTMYTSVLERTKEIGIMKALGAKNKDVIIIFLVEAGVLGLLGGIVGITIGIGLGKLVEFGAAQAGYDFFKVSFSITLIVSVALFSFIIGAIAGVLPAIRAAQQKPVEALRYE